MYFFAAILNLFLENISFTQNVLSGVHSQCAVTNGPENVAVTTGDKATVIKFFLPMSETSEQKRGFIILN